jgi:diguanylate cyclase (GGDEF)-like protein
VDKTTELPEVPPAPPHGRPTDLNGPVATMRAVLVQLLQEVVRAEGRLERSQAAQLMEANQSLIVSALDAQTDADAAHRALEAAYRASRLDPLTGLPNRMLLLDRFEGAIANAKRHGHRVALLFLDLDAFKNINHALGHAAGDHVLKLVADGLKSIVRDTDTVSRHGGDEFLILLAEVSQPEAAAHVASKVNAVLAARRLTYCGAAGLAASIGISVFPEDGADAKVLIERAEAAMNRAKKQGLGGYVFHARHPASGSSPSTRAGDVATHRSTQDELSVLAQDQRNLQLREANEALVLAALGAHELLAAAEASRVRQVELLNMVAGELSDPFAPIRLAAATLGMSGAESMLLARVQEVVEAQADKLSRMVRQVLDQQGKDGSDGSLP